MFTADNSAHVLRPACVMDSPDLPVGGWRLSDDRAGLGRRDGLLDHDARAVVRHPHVATLVLVLPPRAVQRQVLARER